jgi:hypothetical protein
LPSFSRERNNDKLLGDGGRAGARKSVVLNISAVFLPGQPLSRMSLDPGGSPETKKAEFALEGKGSFLKIG